MQRETPPQLSRALVPTTPTVAAPITYGCSFHHLRLQLSPPTVAGELWSVRSDYASGNLGWDPSGLKPTGAAELQEMQTKEINNGRSVNEL